MERAVIACLELIGTAKDDDLAVKVRKNRDDGRKYIPEWGFSDNHWLRERSETILVLHYHISVNSTERSAPTYSGHSLRTLITRVLFGDQ
jgi:hypothetical protein